MMNLRNAIISYAKEKGLELNSIIEDPESNKEHWEHRMLGDFLHSTAQSGDEIIICDASNLARSIAQILEIMVVLVERGITLHLVRYNKVFSAEESMNAVSVLKLISHIESDFVAKRTTEALARRRAAGLPLGRPKGRLNKSLKLDPHRKEIQKYLNLRVSKASIAKLIDCHAQTLYNYIEARNLKPQGQVHSTKSKNKRSFSSR